MAALPTTAQGFALHMSPGTRSGYTCVQVNNAKQDSTAPIGCTSSGSSYTVLVGKYHEVNLGTFKGRVQGRIDAAVAYAKYTGVHPPRTNPQSGKCSVKCIFGIVGFLAGILAFGLAVFFETSPNDLKNDLLK